MLHGEEVAAGQAVAVAVRAYRHYQAGFLPAAGGIADQPPFLIDCLEVIDRAVTDHQETEAAERERRISDRQSRQPGQPGQQRGAPIGQFDGPPPGRPGYRPNWRAHIRPVRRGRR